MRAMLAAKQAMDGAPADTARCRCPQTDVPLWVLPCMWVLPCWVLPCLTTPERGCKPKIYLLAPLNPRAVEVRRDRVAGAAIRRAPSRQDI
jgi:hypothetical protein